MSDERWIRVRTIVERALELEGSDREDYLAAATSGDSALRSEVNDWLGAELPDGWLDPPNLAQGELEEGMQLGEFQLVRELGRGGMGVVYLAHQSSLTREVALKVFHENLTTSERELERFHREARAVARLDHPNVVRVFADGHEGRAHWFAMEYVAGHDLGTELDLQRVRKPGDRACILPGRDDEAYYDATARLAAAVADALEHAHQKRLVHRDIKPANVLLRPDGTPVVGDFGIVRDEALGKITATGMLTGTPNYMSPEQTRAAADSIDHRTDVYSLGVVLYELLSGQRAYEGPTEADVFMSIRESNPQPIRSVIPEAPKDLATIAGKAMRAAPEDRYATAGAMAADLRRFLSRKAIQARPKGLAKKGAEWATSRRGLLLGGLAVAGVGAVSWKIANSLLRAGLEGRAKFRVVDAQGRRVFAQFARRRMDLAYGFPGPLEDEGERAHFDGFVEPGLHRFEFREGNRFASLTRALEPGESIEEEVRLVEADTSDMVQIEAGSWNGLSNFAYTEPGLPTIEVDRFLIDRTAVSNAEWREFALAQGVSMPGYFEDLPDDLADEKWRLPVVRVLHEEAVAYAEFRGKRLPTMYEWMLAAHGSEVRRFPWGSGEGLRGNVSTSTLGQTGFTDYIASAVPVDSMPEAATPEGLLHMYGNVYEWTESAGSSLGLQYPLPGSLASRVALGGDWQIALTQAGEFGGSKVFGGPSVALALNMEFVTLASTHSIGLRCVRDLPS